MIIRKPYAFLMKNFRKIHILLFIFSIYVFYKTTTFYSFVKQYMSTGVYNPLIESVKNYVSDFFYLILILIFLVIGAIFVLLKKKKKPVLDYIIVFIEYVFVLIVFIIGAKYFNDVGSDLVVAKSIRLVRDLLLICSIPQYAIFVWLIIRILGIDLNRFGFKEDEEFKEISEEDREEVEVAVEVDKDVYKRQLKKRLRFLKYYYKENAFFLNIVFGVIFVTLVFVIGRAIALGDKSYKEGKTFNANNYSITINDSYISNFDKSGNIIEKNSGFVIVDVTVVNNSVGRIMDIEKFLLVSNKYKYVPTLKYNNDFKDLGKGYVKNEYKRGSKNRFILIYKVDKDMLDKKFAIYYQNVRGRFELNYCKVKLKPEIYTKKESKAIGYLGKKLKINDKVVNIESMEIGNNYSYLHQKCTEQGCFIGSSNLESSTKKIIKLNLDTEDFDGYSFIDFLDTYGKIIYRVEGKKYTINIKNPIAVKYNGNSSLFLVDSNIEKADEIYLSITVRNNEYIYYLKGDKVNEGNNK